MATGTYLGGYGTPGIGSLDTTSERQIFWGGDDAKGLVLRANAVIAGASRDAGNTPTFVMRPGLLLGVITASGYYAQWDSTATDGSQVLAGILGLEARMQDFNGNDADRSLGVIVRAPLKASQLLIKGSSLVGHADEFLARRQLWALGCMLDDDLNGAKAGALMRTVAKTADYTVTTGDNNTLFTTQGAGGAVNFTLPPIKKGLVYEFFNEADQNMTVTAATADTMVTFNDLAADSVAFSTTSEKIGGKVKVRANADASKWLVEVSLGAETQTPTIAT